MKRRVINITLVQVSVFAIFMLTAISTIVEEYFSVGLRVIIIYNIALINASMMLTFILYSKISSRIEFVKIKSELNDSILFRNAEALLMILSSISIRKPMPFSRGWAVSPDFLSLVVSTILTNKPKVILELGSGISTIYTAYSLEKNNCGKLYSIDHDNHFLCDTKKNIEEHLLNDFAELIHAPLQNIVINNEKWLWYSLDKLNIMDIDLLIIDGPPGYIQKNARYPAMPLLFDSLVRGAVILIDDYDRLEDRDNISRWLKLYPSLRLIEFNTEKGAAMLIKD